MTSSNPKIFILIADGVSLRNFAFTNFVKLAKKRGYDVVFWHHTAYDLSDLGFQELKLMQPKLFWLTTILKNARKHIEISRFAKRDKQSIYYEYLFPLNFKGIKNIVKSVLTNLVTFIFNSERGLNFIRKTINNLEQKTSYYKNCKATLQEQQPDLVYCTSQRAALAIAPMQAAKNLGIPTICFVFSWDNLPKATLDVTANFYNVWSQHMKDELLHYHLFIAANQVTVTGTPQFECHYNSDEIIPKASFYNTYKLNLEKAYICYSGDDVTTSPKDPLYLRDVALAIRKLNNKGYKLGLIFRRCPVDVSNRYDEVIREFDDIIVAIEPIWKAKGEVWITILPTKEDAILLASLAAHTDLVINLGSSMVFDFAIHNKPCMFMNYNYFNSEEKSEKGVYVYDYVHFRSKPSEDAVCWLNHPDEISEKIENLLKDSSKTVSAAKQWFNVINKQPANEASSSILKEINTILNNN